MSRQLFSSFMLCDVVFFYYCMGFVLIDLIHKWQSHLYSFVQVQISLPSLFLEQEFFSIHCMVSRLGRLICTWTKEL